jgi:hypothetical protein
MERKTPLRRRTPLRVKGISETSEVKQRIQDLVREIVIKRDRDCILGNYGLQAKHQISSCNGYAKDGHLILQADHLITRANSATYADTRLIVCVCRGHHHWKTFNKERYDEMVRFLIGPERCALWDKMYDERYKPHRNFTHDWKIEEAYLKQQLKEYENNTDL